MGNTTSNFFALDCEQKVCRDYVMFFTREKKVPSSFSKNEKEKEISEAHTRLLFQKLQKTLFLYS